MGNSTENQKVTTKALLGQKSIQQRFEELLGRKSQGFISSVLQIVNDNKLLSQAEPGTVLNAAATAASLDLPINQNLGFAWIVPYKDNKQRRVVAQFQMGWKGYVQLAQRTGQYHRINAIPVYENQFQSFNTLTEDLNADFSQPGAGNVVGYAAYFRMINGFEKLCYWPKEKVTAHAKRYSKAFGTSFSPWSDEDQFDAMAMKTVLKNTLSKWGILSIEMQTAVVADQAVQTEDGKYQYVDNQPKGIDLDGTDFEKEKNRVIDHINKSEDVQTLSQVYELADEYGLTKEYNAKYDKLEKVTSDVKEEE